MMSPDTIGDVLSALADTQPDDAIAGCGVFVGRQLASNADDDTLARDVAALLRRMADAICNVLEETAR